MFTAAPMAATALARLDQIPFEFWWKIALALLGIVAVVLAVRRVAQMNKVVLTVVAGVVVSAIGFTWIYERNEPSWATPVVSFLAEYFPSKGTVERR